MMRISKYIPILAFLASACSVSDTFETGSTLDLSAVNKEKIKTTTVASLEKWNIRTPLGLVKQGTNVIISDLKGGANAIMIDLDKGNKQDLLYKGRDPKSPGQTTALNSVAGQGVSALDYRTGRFFRTGGGVNTRSGLSVTETEEIIQLPEGEQHLFAAQAGNCIVSTGAYEQGRYLLYHPATGKASYHLSYPDYLANPGLKEETKAILWASSVLRVSPDNQRFVCADMYSGTIDFCRITADRIERVRTQSLHQPKVQIREGSKRPVAYSRDNRFGFTDVTVTGDRVFASYSGQTYRADPRRFQQCRTLLVFDWDGNLLHRYSLDLPFTHISYDQAEGMIYALGYTPRPALIKFAL